MSSLDKAQMVRNAIIDGKVVFYFLPSARLKDLILQDKHPVVKSLPQKLRVLFLENKGIAISNDMVLKFVDGSIDENNKFVLNNGEIRAIDNNHIRLSGSDLIVGGG